MSGDLNPECFYWKLRYQSIKLQDFWQNLSKYWRKLKISWPHIIPVRQSLCFWDILEVYLFSSFDSPLVTFTWPLKLYFQTIFGLIKKNKKFLPIFCTIIGMFKQSINLSLWNQGFMINFVESNIFYYSIYKLIFYV